MHQTVHHQPSARVSYQDQVLWSEARETSTLMLVAVVWCWMQINYNHKYTVLQPIQFNLNFHQYWSLLILWRWTKDLLMLKISFFTKLCHSRFCFTVTEQQLKIMTIFEIKLHSAHILLWPSPTSSDTLLYCVDVAWIDTLENILRLAKKKLETLVINHSALVTVISPCVGQWSWSVCLWYDPRPWDQLSYILSLRPSQHFLPLHHSRGVVKHFLHFHLSAPWSVISRLWSRWHFQKMMKPEVGPSSPPAKMRLIVSRRQESESWLFPFLILFVWSAGEVSASEWLWISADTHHHHQLGWYCLRSHPHPLL